MQYINQDQLVLINPKAVKAGERISYYSPTPIEEGMILYSVTPECTLLFRTGKTTYTKLHKAMMALHVEGLIRYTVTTYLQEINAGPERDRHLGELVKLNALPY